MKYLIVMLVCAFVGCSPANTNNVSDEIILQLVLKRSLEDGGYIVVSPKAGFSHNHDTNELAKTKKYVVEQLKSKIKNIDELFDKLVEKNRKPTQLKIKSSPQEGYLVDYDGEYEKYFKKDRGGWEHWYKEHPKAHGNTTVSLPL